MLTKHHPVNTGKPKGNFWRKTLLVLCILCITFIIGYTTKMLKNFLDLRVGKLITVDGIVLTDKTSPENRIIMQFEDSSLIDWQNEPDLEEEKNKIEQQIQTLRKALKSKNIRKIASCFTQTKQEYYRQFFTENKDNLDLFFDIFNNMEMTYMSPDTSKNGNPYYRMAEYTAIWKDKDVIVVFIKEDGQWVIESL